MATDQSPPKTHLIALYAVLSVLVLAALKPAFDGYFAQMSQDQIHTKILSAPTVQKNAYQVEIKKGFSRTTVQLDEALSALAKDSREAFASISPVASDDLRALQGWTHASKLQRMDRVVPNPTRDEETAALPAVDSDPVSGSDPVLDSVGEDSQAGSPALDLKPVVKSKLGGSGQDAAAAKKPVVEKAVPPTLSKGKPAEADVDAPGAVKAEGEKP